MKLSKKHYSLISTVLLAILALLQWAISPVALEDNHNGKYLSVEQARQQQLHDVQVLGSGIVERLLADDLKGSRHQRIIVREPSGATLLVVHNIDLAPRIDGIKLGDKLSYFGEYIWNKKGGLVHWTHHDPKGKHIGGWLEHNGKRYE